MNQSPGTTKTTTSETGDVEALTTEQLYALPPSMPIEMACNALGISKATGYRLVRANAFPCPVVRLGRAIRVPKPGLLRVLGLDQQARVVSGA